jgi:hypothetical protein
MAGGDEFRTPGGHTRQTPLAQTPLAQTPSGLTPSERVWKLWSGSACGGWEMGELPVGLVVLYAVQCYRELVCQCRVRACVVLPGPW